MAKNNLKELKDSYKELAQECTQSGATYARITGVCRAIAMEGCYTNAEKGMRLKAFFKALEEVI